MRKVARSSLHVSMELEHRFESMCSLFRRICYSPNIYNSMHQNYNILKHGYIQMHANKSREITT